MVKKDNVSFTGMQIRVTDHVRFIIRRIIYKFIITFAEYYCSPMIQCQHHRYIQMSIIQFAHFITLTQQD